MKHSTLTCNLSNVGAKFSLMVWPFIRISGPIINQVFFSSAVAELGRHWLSPKSSGLKVVSPMHNEPDHALHTLSILICFENNDKFTLEAMIFPIHLKLSTTTAPYLAESTPNSRKILNVLMFGDKAPIQTFFLKQ